MFLNLFFTTALVVFVYMTVWFLLSRVVKRNDIADLAWGLGFIVVVATSYLNTSVHTLEQYIIYLLVTIWGIRLALHIYVRLRKKSEDYRYKQMAEKWGKNFALRSYLQVFLLQGIFLYLISSPIIWVGEFGASNVLHIGDFLGIVVWIIGFGFEAISDYQLGRFKSDPKNKGKIMQSGLWKYSRHPNYFGEVLGWWGIWLIVVSLPLGALSIISPLTISFLILKISGIPLLEKKYSNNHDYQEYKKRTSIFVPLLPRK